MTKKKKNVQKRERKISTWLKEPKIKMQFSCSIGIVLLMLIVVAFAISFPLAIVNSTVITKLQHYTCSSRSSDWENPKVVHTTTCVLEIELQYEHLAEAGGIQDVWIVLLKAPLPVTDSNDWMATGTVVDEVYLSGDGMLPYCSGYDGVQYYTTFQYTWGGLPALEEGILYCIYIDFYDADGEFWYCPTIQEAFFGDGGLDLIGFNPRPNSLMPNNCLQIMVDEEGTYYASDFIGCANISFFIYEPYTEDEDSTNTNTGTTTPPVQTTDPNAANYQKPINPNGLQGDSWTSGAMTNWVFLVLMLAILLLLALILAIVIIAIKKKNQ